MKVVVIIILLGAAYIVTPEKPKHLPKIGTSEAIKGYNNNQET